MKQYVYVLDKDGNPLMPTTRYGKVRRMLRDGKASVVSTKPFTIRLAEKTETSVVQQVACGMDPGRTNIGIAAVREDGECLYLAHCTTRNKEICDLMDDRRKHRRASRRGERLARKRLAKKLGTTMKHILNRKLPGFKKGTLLVKDIINTEARFNNRRRLAGWLTPTATQLLRTHLRLLELVGKILPVSDVVVELNKFSFLELDNPGVKKWDLDYQHGPLHGHDGVNDAVSIQQGGICLLCGAPIDRYHHIVPLSKGGSNTIGNIAGLCLECHKKVHNDQEAFQEMEEKKAGLNKKYGALSVLNQIVPRLAEGIAKRYPGHAFATYGWETSRFRERYGIQKSHHSDAFCIAASILESPIPVLDCQTYEILQFRRHDRANIQSQRERVYKLGKEIVARNRKKRMDQKKDSLQEWFEKTVRKYGLEKAEALRSVLTVEKSSRRYNNRNREFPGALFRYKGKTYLLKSQITKGMYYRAYGCGDKNFPAKKCRILKHNTGLVYVP